MTANLKATVALVAIALIAAVAIGVVVSSGDDDDGIATAAASGPGNTIRADSHRLSEAKDGKVTLVEFLDFECESCRAAYPGLERIRAEYDGRITFAIRYFPIPSHRNAVPSALAVESAARQGKLEPMYKKMYETQAEWGESQELKEDVFIGFAREMGLDMDKFMSDFRSPEVEARVLSDMENGQALGVQGTPTLFLNGEMLQDPSYEGVKAAIDAALAE